MLKCPIEIISHPTNKELFIVEKDGLIFKGTKLYHDLRNIIPNYHSKFISVCFDEIDPTLIYILLEINIYHDRLIMYNSSTGENQTLLELPNSNHAGQIKFNRYLYLCLPSTPREDPRSFGNPFGKILRINPSTKEGIVLVSGLINPSFSFIGEKLLVLDQNKIYNLSLSRIYDCGIPGKKEQTKSPDILFEGQILKMGPFIDENRTIIYGDNIFHIFHFGNGRIETFSYPKNNRILTLGIFRNKTVYFILMDNRMNINIVGVGLNQ